MNNDTSNLVLAGLLRESPKSLTVVTNSPADCDCFERK